ncbi:hypothetical protein [Pseudomonas sp. LB3P14]
MHHKVAGQDAILSCHRSFEPTARLSTPNYLCMAVGEFSDPEPMIEPCNGEDAVYDMILATETGDSLEMSFGWFRMRFTKEQALWLWFHLSIAANCLGQHRWIGVI